MLYSLLNSFSASLSFLLRISSLCTVFLSANTSALSQSICVTYDQLCFCSSTQRVFPNFQQRGLRSTYYVACGAERFCQCLAGEQEQFKRMVRVCLQFSIQRQYKLITSNQQYHHPPPTTPSITNQKTLVSNSHTLRSISLPRLVLQQYIYQTMLKGLLFSAILLFCLTNAAYQPQLMLTATSDIINKQIAINYGDIISKKINEYEIKDISGEQKTAGVTIHYNLSKIKQHVGIIWKANILQVKNTHSFVINSKNVSFDLNGYLEVKIGITRKQKGNLAVKITGLEVDTTVRFASNKCPHSVGFDIQVDDVYVNTNSISIKIEGKGFDNLVISELEKIIIPRVPGLIKNALNDKVNPLISQYTCNRIEYDLAVNNVFYILIVNTTQVPEFDDGLKILRFPVDITLQNLKTNETNDELERDDLPLNQLFQGSSDVSVALSSNFLNTILWLVEDSKILNQVVTNAMLGPNPPIALNTTNLSILMPNLKKQWPNKEVFLIISPSSRYEHLLIRSGRIVTVLSLSVQFAVNVTGKPLAADECLKSGDCVVACNLNMTLPVSLALKLGNKLAIGLLHQASFYDISVIDSKIDINLVTLKAIINEIIGSMLPDLNQQLADGFELPASILQKLAKYDVSDIMSKTFQDFLALGLKLDL